MRFLCLTWDHASVLLVVLFKRSSQDSTFYKPITENNVVNAITRHEIDSINLRSHTPIAARQSLYQTRKALNAVPWNTSISWRTNDSIIGNNWDMDQGVVYTFTLKICQEWKPDLFWHFILWYISCTYIWWSTQLFYGLNSITWFMDSEEANRSDPVQIHDLQQI